MLQRPPGYAHRHSIPNPICQMTIPDRFQMQSLLEVRFRDPKDHLLSDNSKYKEGFATTKQQFSVAKFGLNNMNQEKEISR